MEKGPKGPNHSGFSATQILREINFGHLVVPKTAILTIWVAPNFEFLKTFDIFKYENPKPQIQSLQNCWNGNI